MRPEDRDLARAALLKNRLTVDQVSEIQKECEASGRPFAQEALARGFLTPREVLELQGGTPPSAIPAPASPSPPRRTPSPADAKASAARPAPPRVPPVFQALLAASLAILVVLVIASLFTLHSRGRKDEQFAEEATRAIADSERQSQRARIDYERRIVEDREAKAAAALEKGRTALKSVDGHADPASDPNLYTRLVEATVSFTAYLEAHPEDAPVHVERARSYELRHNYDKAVDDLERAIAVRKDLEPSLRERLGRLRSLLPKK